MVLEFRNSLYIIFGYLYYINTEKNDFQTNLTTLKKIKKYTITPKITYSNFNILCEVNGEVY